jgi:preprotein translocase subunit SecF
MQLKKLIFVPLLLFSLAAFILLHNYFATKDFLLKDVDLTGGTLILIETAHPVDSKAIEPILLKKYETVIISSLQSVTGYGISVQTKAEVSPQEVVDTIRSAGVDVVNFSVQTIGPALGNIFYTQITLAISIAFVLMSVVIFIAYRNLISSLAMIFATAANLLTTLALASLFGIRIGFASMAALLMLIGYTIDSNIILTHKVMRADMQSFRTEYKKALKTGLTLTATITITMFFAWIFSDSRLLQNIAQILVIGFLSDTLYTWIFNSSILEIWKERRPV